MLHFSQVIFYILKVRSFGAWSIYLAVILILSYYPVNLIIMHNKLFKYNTASFDIHSSQLSLKETDEYQILCDSSFAFQRELI